MLAAKEHILKYRDDYFYAAATYCRNYRRILANAS
jgi:hypothetical protein